jgi:tetratricopeptide (TPR) repeat protein
MNAGNVIIDEGLAIAAVPAEPTDAQTVNRRGIARLQGGDAAGALEDFRRAALLKPDYPEPWNNSGLLRHMLGQFGPAVADFDRALAIRPDYPEALTNRGRARQALGDPAGARADFDRALAIAGTGGFAASVLHNRGALRQDSGDLAGARADYDRALQIDPGHTATLVRRGSARKEAGDLHGALADFDRALEQNPSQGLAAIYHGRGGVRVLLNDFAGALRDYDQALSLEPDKFHLYISRGNARYHCRDPRGVVDFRMAFRLDPEGAADELLRIITADARRNPQAVLDNCTRHLRINAGDLLASARRGLTLLLLGRDAEAEPDLARVRAHVPDLQAHLQRLVQLARRSGFPEATVKPADPGRDSRERLIDAAFAAYGKSFVPASAGNSGPYGMAKLATRFASGMGLG